MVMRYPLTFYTAFGVPMAACTYGPVILIKPEYKDDEGLYQHELIHVKQWIFTLGLHSILYLLSNRYKLWAEVQAYRKQLEYSPGNEARFAGFIANRYGLAAKESDVLVMLHDS